MYFIFCAASSVLFLRVKGIRNEVNSVNYGWFELLFLTFPIPSNGPYFLLLGIDCVNLATTIWGSVLYFGSEKSDFF